MGAAAVEPDVEDVADHLVIVGVSPSPRKRAALSGRPGVDARFADRLDDALVDVRSTSKLAGLALDEQGDRNAPGALAADHPVGPPSTIEPMRLRPFSGTKRVSAMAREVGGAAANARRHSPSRRRGRR
jgi:hypothetical protein